MKRKLVIMGAGVYQVPLLELAKSMGFYTICVSPMGPYPGIEMCDLHLDEDVRDFEKVATLLAPIGKIDGICTAGSDVSVVSIAQISSKLGLPCYSVDAARCASDKILMKNFMDRNCIRTAAFREIKGLSDCVSFVQCSKSAKFVIKSPKSSGSRGIYICTRRDVVSTFLRLQSHNNTSNFLIEEFIEGQEYGAQVFVEEGSIIGIIFHSDILHHGEHNVPVGHGFPYNVSAGIREQLSDMINKIILALKLENVIMNIDLIENDAGIFIIEFAFRIGATCIPEGIEASYGFNVYDMIIRIAENRKYSQNFSKQPISASLSGLLFSNVSGTIKSIQIPKKIFSDNSVFDFKLDAKVGDTINAFCTGNHRLGHLVVCDSSLGKAQNRLTRYMSQIKIIIDE